MGSTEFQEKAALIGGRALLRTDDHDLRFPVQIHDVARSYGRWRFHVSPVGGQGVKWVDETRLTLDGVT